jgi:hypothetical protein
MIRYHSIVLNKFVLFILRVGNTLKTFPTYIHVVVLHRPLSCQGGELCRNSNTEMSRNKSIDDDDVDLLQLDVQE